MRTLFQLSVCNMTFLRSTSGKGSRFLLRFRGMPALKNKESTFYKFSVSQIFYFIVCQSSTTISRRDRLAMMVL
jgi:hypothetical protein